MPLRGKGSGTVRLGRSPTSEKLNEEILARVLDELDKPMPSPVRNSTMGNMIQTPLEAGDSLLMGQKGKISNGASDERIIWPDNDKFFRILQEVLNRLHSPISISLA